MNGPKPGNQSEVKNTYGFESIDSDYDETGDDDPEEETDDDASGRSGPGTFPPLNLRLRPFRASRAQIGVGCENFSNVVDLSEPARISIVRKFYKENRDVSKFCQQFSKFVIPK
jgi:hypothetical protein